MRIFTKESLQYIPDYEVEKHYRNLQDKINDIRKSKSKDRHAKHDKLMLETEVCYIHREIEDRRERKKSHAKYILGLS